MVHIYAGSNWSDYYSSRYYYCYHSGERCSEEWLALKQMTKRKPFDGVKDGALHDRLGIPRDKKIPMKALRDGLKEALKDPNEELLQKRIEFVIKSRTKK